MGVLTLGKNFYIKLALTNLFRDKKMYIPYVIANTTIVSVYFMVVTIIYSKGLADVPSGDSLQMMFRVGMVVMSIFTVIFMLYINSFLIKRRKKEFGLYGILGLEKRHVARVIIWENLILNVFSILLGMVIGLVFGKLIFLLIFYALKVTANSRFLVPYQAFTYTSVMFMGIFIVTTIFNLLHVSLANPIDLLKGGQIGEKKVRFIIPLTLIGSAGLGWAYYTALTVTRAIAALNLFMVAVIVVIFSTYILFTSGSIFLLRILKKNKKIYYKANNFISISSMFHRMKQNAAGLATICILSTMVLVTVSTCTSLYIGMEEILGITNPNDMEINMTGDATKEQILAVDNKINELSEKYEITFEDKYSYYTFSDILLLKDGILSSGDFDSTDPSMSTMMEMEEYLWDIKYITIDDYNKVCGGNESLSTNEVIILGSKELSQVKELKLDTDKYIVKSIELNTKFTKGKNGEIPKQIYMVFSNLEEATKYNNLMNPDRVEVNYKRITILNLDGSNDELNKFSHEVLEKGYLENVYNITSLSDDREFGYGLYGGLLFLGTFFTILFLAATVLIIYFKQVSEGYDDKDRFVILQKVGMDDIEVKKTINKQILIVFFLPLLAALLHLWVARHMIIKLLEVFYLYNVSLTTICMAVTSLVFIVAYIIVFRLTARTYYKIVKW
jgi:putative ABC transport system permease protein